MATPELSPMVILKILRFSLARAFAEPTRGELVAVARSFPDRLRRCEGHSALEFFLF